MVDKRNLVIKVKYPVSGKMPNNLAPRVITKWNVKRILFAVGALLIVFISLFCVIDNDTQHNDLDKDSAINNAAVEKPAAPQVDVKQAKIKNLTGTKRVAAKSGSLVKPIKKADKKNKPAIIIKDKGMVKKYQ